MRKAIFIILTVMLFSVGKSFAYNDGDVQVWNTDVEEMKISEKWKAVAEQEFRWGRNAEQFFYQHYDFGLIFSVNKHWNLGMGFRHILTKSNGDWKIEDDPYVMATLSGELAGFKVENRHRLEYQHFDYKNDNGRYRNKLALKLPWKFTRLEIQPFFSDEIFVRFVKEDPFNQNRFSSGLSMNMTKNFKTELYYMLQSSKGSAGWTDAHVIGTKFKLCF